MKIYFRHRAINSLFSSGLSVLSPLTITSSLVLLLLFSSAAGAIMSGSAAITYTKFDSSFDSPTSPGQRNSMTANSLVQDYSLLYTSSNSVYNSRIGNYNVALGYNWTALDTTFKYSTKQDDLNNKARGHLLYKGEINIDPKEIPFKLYAYSRDLSSISTVSDASKLQNYGSVIGQGNLLTDINDGLHIESGVTLVAGVKNGMTNGYNEFLRHFPMILIDFKDTINRDLRSTSQVDDRLTRLAFVSLNKKDNWFHYRHTQYTDYINSKNNYEDNEIQLGTVDQFMTRRWIDFTNWIKVSTDLQLSNRKSNYQTGQIENINLNMFVEAERTNWNARSFTSFSRTNDDLKRISYQTSVPLYVSGEFSRDLSWTTRTSYRENHDIDARGASSGFTNSLFGYRVDAFKGSPFTLSQGIDVESSTATTSDLLTLSGTLETNSTYRFSRDVSLGAVYNIVNSSTSGTATSSSNHLEQTLDMRGIYLPNNTLRFELQQKNSISQGAVSTFGATTSNSYTQLSQYSSLNDATSKSYHSSSSLSAFWNPKPRLNTNLALEETIEKSDALATTYATSVRSDVSYSNSVFDVSDQLAYSRGNMNSTNSISNSTSLRYNHSRSLNANVAVTYMTSSSKGENSKSTSFEQGLNYSFFTTNGITRKLLEFNERLSYTHGLVNSSITSGKYLTLGFRYYPLSRLTLAGGMGYSYSNSINDYTMSWNASATGNFKLLQASVDYVSGIKTTGKVRENRLTGRISKSF